MSDLRIRIEGCRPAFVPRAQWVLSEFADALGATARFTDGEADCVFGPTAPTSGVWIPADPAAQSFFEHRDARPGRAAFQCQDLTLLFAPTAPDRPIPGDLVASAFFLMARWDEWCTDKRDKFDRLRYSDSSFATVDGLDIAEPAVEGYISRLRDALGLPAPSTWSVFLTHDIDDLKGRTPRRITGRIMRRGVSGLSALVQSDPWNNIPEMLWTTSQRGLAPTVFLIGRNRHRLDGAPQALYERERANLAKAVTTSGGEVGLHCAFASSEDPEALTEELKFLRAETGLPVAGVRFHYLRMRYHESVRWLEQAGVDYDSSLGFNDMPGYAAGVARPFHPYLIGEERAATVQLVPLAVSDFTLRSALGLNAEHARERALAVLDATRRAGGASALLWHNTSFNDDRSPGYGPLWEDLLDTLIERGAHLGPIRPPAAAPGARLDGRTVLHVTSVHRPRDVRIFHKETAAARKAGASADVLGLETPVTRGKRIVAGWRLVRKAAKSGADVYHFHDPELLPASLWLAKRTGKPVIYDLHEYLGGTVRTKRWLPAAIRRPLAVVAERAEFAMASRLPGIVGSNEDLAARFAVRGQRATVVTNAPWSSSFPVPPPATEPIVLYVGGLSPIRGLTVMKDAFALVTHPGARLLLVGPGDPGELADNVEWLGVVDHSEVAALVARSAISWVPLQYNGNYQKIVPTKLIEAMASARPVVTSNFGRMAQIARAANCGLLVPPDDPQAHAAAIDRLLGDPELAATMGRAGRDAFERGWAFERQADRLTSFYDQLIREGR